MQAKLKISILKVLVYFDLFNYPVSQQEIQFFLDRKAKEEELEETLVELVANGLIFRIDQFYSLQDDPDLVNKRIKENSQAQSLLIIARRISKFLFGFPFVRGIGISGSLSKNVADENADIDYFIITEPDKLWIARTIMHLFKKLTFLTGHQHWYCMNYYVDGIGLQIEEKNIFTATELVTLLPICGRGTMEKLFGSNNWIKAYFPNYTIRMAEETEISVRFHIKKRIESIFNNGMGRWLDNYLMKITSGRWKQKEAALRLNSKGNRMGLKTDKHFCKPNPSFFHEKILARYAKRMQELEIKWEEITLGRESIAFFS